MFGLRLRWDETGATPFPRFFWIMQPPKTTPVFTSPLHNSSKHYINYGCPILSLYYGCPILSLYVHPTKHIIRGREGVRMGSLTVVD
jgi:hypothetical protein